MSVDSVSRVNITVTRTKLARCPNLYHFYCSLLQKKKIFQVIYVIKRTKYICFERLSELFFIRDFSAVYK